MAAVIAKQKMFHPVMGGCTLLLTLMFWTVPHAYAGEREDYFQITCKPESNYFALRTLVVQVPDCKVYRNCQTKDADTPDSRLFDPYQFIKSPYVCRLQKSLVAVELINFQPARGRGMCGGIARYDVRIRINDKVSHEFQAYGYNRCEKGETHLIEFTDHSDLLRDCALPDDSQFSPTCSTKKTSADDTSADQQAVTTK